MELKLRREKIHTKTHEFLQILPVLPVETHIGLPDPRRSWVMPRTGRKEDESAIDPNPVAEIQFAVRIARSLSEITENVYREQARRRRTSNGNRRKTEMERRHQRENKKETLGWCPRCMPRHVHAR